MGAALPRIFVAGLGNITHPATRHSLGQVIVDSLAARLGITMSSSMGGRAGDADVRLGDNLVSVTLYKSNSLMNVSGPSIARALRKIVPQSNPPTALILIHDSLSHRPCTLSPRLGGSANGHNGIKSVISALGGQADFYRLRAGIGRGEGDVANYVLGRLSSYEKQYWGVNGEGIEQALNEIAKIARGQL
ncbi:hypothetical protein HGRIS_002786 [Hohenbuehelia grisea]|uniref:peptidyl-tRNA hydrolase n=1 Tax=Hohenbuehelia grisea TaxID=104357 RepID=A0ABR3JLJ2_9AGAR